MHKRKIPKAHVSTRRNTIPQRTTPYQRRLVVGRNVKKDNPGIRIRKLLKLPVEK